MAESYSLRAPLPTRQEGWHPVSCWGYTGVTAVQPRAPTLQPHCTYLTWCTPPSGTVLGQGGVRGVIWGTSTGQTSCHYPCWVHQHLWACQWPSPEAVGMGGGRIRHNSVALVVCATPNNIDVVTALCFLLCGRTSRSVLRQKNLYVNLSFRYQIWRWEAEVKSAKWAHWNFIIFNRKSEVK